MILLFLYICAQVYEIIQWSGGQARLLPGIMLCGARTFLRRFSSSGGDITCLFYLIVAIGIVAAVGIRFFFTVAFILLFVVRAVGIFVFNLVAERKKQYA
jgi:hypothetical protein